MAAKPLAGRPSAAANVMTLAGQVLRAEPAISGERLATGR